MTQPIPEISTQQFRAELATYLDSGETLAITRHGEVVGYYIPARDPNRLREEYARLRSSAERVRDLLEAAGLNEEEFMAEFRESARDPDKNARAAAKRAE